MTKKKAFPAKKSLSEQDTLGGRLQKAREARGLSVSQAARRLGILPKTLSNWEANSSEPRANQLQKLSGVLNAPSVWLIGGIDVHSYEDDEIPELSETADLERRLIKLIKVHAETSQLLFDMQIELRRLQAKFDSADSGV